MPAGKTARHVQSHGERPGHREGAPMATSSTLSQIASSSDQINPLPNTYRNVTDVMTNANRTARTKAPSSFSPAEIPSSAEP